MFSGLQEMFSSEQEMFSWEQEQEMFSWEQEMSHNREQEQEMFSSEQEMFSWEQEQEMFSWKQQMSQQQISTSPEQNTDLRINIEKILEEARKAETPDAWYKVCILRVPRKLRDVNPSAFDPQIVSIGPYHRGKDVLRDMDVHKKRCFRRILIRNGQRASLYFDSIKEVVEDAKKCYEGNINLSINEFVETMVLDGCFLLEILFGFSEGATYFEEKGYSTNDPVYSERGPIEVMKKDMLKLENQLPLFILGRLLGLISNEENITDQEEKITDLVTEKVLKLFELQEKILEMELVKFRSCPHCLDIYRRGLLRQVQAAPPAPKHPIAPPRSTTKKRRSTHQRETKHPATELREAGVKFKKRETDCFLDIKYIAGVLYIPRILLDDTMKNVIQNLIAFEQTYHRKNNHYEITSYAVFIDDLIVTRADVTYLHTLRIIVPFAGGRYDDAAYFFKQITDGVTYGMYLQMATEGLLKKINDHNKSRISQWMAGGKRKYFSNPWSIISLISAIALLVLTFLQTFYVESIMGVYTGTGLGNDTSTAMGSSGFSVLVGIVRSASQILFCFTCAHLGSCRLYVCILKLKA